MKNPRTPFPAQPKAFSRPAIYAILLLAIAFFAYNAARAWFVAITHDEAFTFNQYVRAGIWEIVKVSGSNSNNHVLNTLVIKVFYVLFGSHWFVLRLYVVLLYGVYLWYGYKLMQFIKSPVLQICGFILLSANPFLFDFFSLARGYLPALACTLPALYFAVKYIHTLKGKALWISLLVSSLAVMFHLSFLNFFVPLCGLLLLYMLLPKNASGLVWKNIFSKGWPVFLVLIAVVAYALPVSLWIKQLGEMDLAGKTGFWQDTVLSLLGFSFYDLPYARGLEFLGLISGVVIILLIFCAVLLVKDLRQSNFYLPYAILSVLLILMFLCIQAQHFILDNPFPNGRLALYFLPLFFLLVVYALDKFNPYHISTFIGLMITILVSFHFIQSINITKTINWETDADTPAMLTLLQKLEGGRKPADPVRLGTNWADEPNINYYRIHGNYNWLKVMSREGFLPNDEYIYVSSGKYKYLNNQAVRIVEKYPVSGNILLRNLYADSLELIARKTASLPDNSAWLDTMQSGPLIQFNRNEIPADSILVEAQAWVMVEKDYVGGALVIAADNLSSQSSIWRSLKISDAIMQNGKWQFVTYSTIISLKNQPGAQVKSYIWNTGKMPLHITGLQLNIYDLKNMKPLFINE